MKASKLEKVNFDELIKEFVIEDTVSFTNYLKEIWKDLARRSNERSKGISKLTFSKYYGLPGIINDRLFEVFDKNKNGYLDPTEFLQGMVTLFTSNFEESVKFIFNFYDFDKDGLITKEDIRVVMSYVPIQTKIRSKSHLKYESEDFNDRVEAQDELFAMLTEVFGKKEKMNQDDFFYVIDNVNSDIFMFILMFLLEKRPFNNQTIAIYELSADSSPKIKKCKTSKTPVVTETKHEIVSPNTKSKFKSPTLKQRRLNNRSSFNMKGASNPILSLYSGKQPIKLQQMGTSQEPMKTDITNDNIHAPHRRDRKKLGNLEDRTPPLGAKPMNEDNVVLSQLEFDNNEEPDSETDDEDDNNNSVDDDISTKGSNYEGFMYKLTKTKKIKKLWFKLICRDIYYFKNKDEKQLKGMHNLSGVYFKENDAITFNNELFYSFAIIYPKQVRHYYLKDKNEYNNWVKELKKAIDVTPLTEFYDVKGNLGKGKFGQVKLGIHKQTGRKVAIKIINKQNMDNQDLELVKTEIDILKISQHPNIIKLYDIFENQDCIFIIMEYCEGSDLFSYIEKRNYKLPEPRAAEIIHKLSAAIYFIHSFGIVHRDLKPENILMTDNSDKADIRLLDFGLSKIIGPGEKCTEPYGTLSYVAPEVLIEKPYDQRVDLWSIGIITYLLLCGCLPFDDEHSEKEIARQTIHDPVPYHPSLWKKLSKESRDFVNKLLQKDPDKRMTIKQILEHEWIKKYYTKVTEERKKSVDISGSSFKLYASVNN